MLALGLPAAVGAGEGQAVGSASLWKQSPAGNKLYSHGNRAVLGGKLGKERGGAEDQGIK